MFKSSDKPWLDRRKDGSYDVIGISGARVGYLKREHSQWMIKMWGMDDCIIEKTFLAARKAAITKALSY